MKVANLEQIFVKFKEYLASVGRSTEGAKLYFRVVAGMKSALDGADKTYFNPDDPCKEVSIAEPVIVELDCSCPTPRVVAISANKPISKKTITACQGETIELTVTPNLTASCQAQWFQTATSPAPNATPNFIGSTYKVAESEMGTKTYFVRVINIDEPDEAGCWRTDSVSIKVNILPPALGDVLDICLNPPIPSATDIIPFSFKSNYANGAYKGEAMDSKFLPYKTLTEKTPLSDTIKVLSGNQGTLLNFNGSQIEVDASGTNPVYHIYLEDVTPIPAQGVLLSGALSDRSSYASSPNVRILLEVKQNVTLESVSIFPRGKGGNSTPITNNTEIGRAHV
jgi:hypothetical protein